MLQQNQLASRDAWKELTDEERQRAAQLRDQVAASLLATLKGQTNSSLRVIAMNSLVGMQPDKATVELLVDIALQDKEPEVRRVVLSNLFRQFSAISSERLLKLYDAEDATEFKSAILKRVSSRLSDDAKGDSLAVTEKWVAKLQQIATESPSPKLRAEAILLLGQVGSNFRKLSPADEK